jgi:hypothetical protein
MKRSLLFALSVIVCAPPAFAQGIPGAINVYSDAAYSDCNVYDSASGLVTLHVVHEYTAFVGSSLFKLDIPDCVGGAAPNDWTLLGVIIPWDLTIGDIFVGISIAYGECMNGPLLLATINYFGNGLTPPCCYISVVASPDAVTGEVQIVDCNLTRMAAVGGQAIVNPGVDCMCDTPASDSTWGGIKALYQ